MHTIFLMLSWFFFFQPAYKPLKAELKVSEQKNISYLPSTAAGYDKERHSLDMFWPAVKENCAVMVFIHGGTWMTGSKELYADLGRNMASKGIAAAVINYRLGDKTTYDGMAADCASAVKWVYENAKKFNADPERITVCGHSAGGHLSALISLDPDYFKKLNIENPVKACLLIDAFGLNMSDIIRNPFAQSYRAFAEKVFSKDTLAWVKGSPVTHIRERKLPFFITVGKNTHLPVAMDNQLFLENLREVNKDITYKEIVGKNHQQMISQLQQAGNPLYTDLVTFIEAKTR